MSEPASGSEAQRCPAPHLAVILIAESLRDRLNHLPGDARAVDPGARQSSAEDRHADPAPPQVGVLYPRGKSGVQSGDSFQRTGSKLFAGKSGPGGQDPVRRCRGAADFKQAWTTAYPRGRSVFNRR